jgi:hypothetical protein
MKRLGFALAGLLALAGPALASEGSARSETPGCGGDAFSYAEVDSGASQKGTIYSVPETLCADLADRNQGKISSFNIYVDPRQGQEQAPGAEPRRRGGPGPAPGRH